MGELMDWLRQNLPGGGDESSLSGKFERGIITYSSIEFEFNGKWYEIKEVKD